MIPLAIAVGILADWSGWAYARLSIGFSCILFCAQLIMIVAPVFHPNSRPESGGPANGQYPWVVMASRDQWDWTPIEEIGRNCGIIAPRVSYLGDGAAFNPPQIERPWVAKKAAGADVTLPDPDVIWLWRYEEGQINWQTVMAEAEQSDLVITAPHFSGDAPDTIDPNDQHNLEFAERLSRNAHFQAPTHLQMGRFEPVDVVVFVNRKSTCPSGGEALPAH